MNPELTGVDWFAFVTVFVAYYIKGFSGFGPALFIIPLFTIFYDPATAIVASTLFDMIAGSILGISVFRRIDWIFVIPVLLLFFPGAWAGVYFMTLIPTGLLEIAIGTALLIFTAILILAEPKAQSRFADHPSVRLLRYPVSFLAGFGGGLTGISGPLLVIYMKLTQNKTFFRDQLIAIFAFGSFWRFFLYQRHSVQSGLDGYKIAVMVLLMGLALWLGSRQHFRIDERRFNRIVGLILLIPAIRLLI